MSETSAGKPQPEAIPLNIYVHDFSPVSALVIGAPGSEWILLPKREAAFWEGHKKSSRLFSEGKTPVEVAIKLDLPADEVQAISRDFLELRQTHKLTEKYEQIQYYLPLLEITQNTK